MTKKNLFEAGIKLFSVYLVYNAFTSTYILFTGPFLESNFDKFEIILLVNIIIQWLLAGLLVFRSENVCNCFRIKDDEDDGKSVSSNARGLLRVGLILVGIVILLFGIQHLLIQLQVFNVYSKMESLPGAGSAQGRMTSLLTGPLVSIFFALIMLFASKVISELLIRDE